MGDVAAARGDPLDGLEDTLLEGAALARAGLLLLRELGLRAARVVQPLDLPLQLGQPLEQAFARLAVVLHLPHDRGLELRQRVVSLLCWELAQQILARLLEELGGRLLDLVLYSGAPLASEVLRK